MNKAEALSCSTELLPATSCIQAVGGVVGKFRQELEILVAELDQKGLDAAQFGSFISSLRGLVNGVGREVVKRVLEEQDTPRPSVLVDGARLRFRGCSEKSWLTPFGAVTVRRRCYRADGPGAAKAVPLDDACGMTERFMTPDLEEMSAMCAAMLTQQETEQLLAKVLPEGPSATAIRNVTTRLGDELAARADELEQAIEDSAPLSTGGDVVVASWDGVMVPLRQGPGGEPAGWKEAGVATVSVYKKGADEPEREDARYFARMPESRMETLVNLVAAQVAQASAACPDRMLMVLCDGNDTIWRQTETREEFSDAILALDFYHAAQNLMHAAKAIFGEGESANAWHKKVRRRLLTSWDGAGSAIRSMRRYLTEKTLPEGRRATLERVIGYFKKHRNKMRYAEWLAQGLPIGSGPVEAAAKDIVQARLKRSGMRWSTQGGQSILELRAHLKSGRWDVMWSTLKAAG
jgi:hypothetical protein